jgi:hypothetical protein
MSLPKRLYELGKAIASSDLVVSKVPSQDNMMAFQELLNQSYPLDEKEAAQREIVRSMYYCNPFGFLQYIGVSRNRVKALILWTESKRIARFFDVNKCVHISWNEETHSYSVVPYVPRNTTTTTTTNLVTNPATRTRRVVTNVQKTILNPNARSYASAVTVTRGPVIRVAPVSPVATTSEEFTEKNWADAV